MGAPHPRTKAQYATARDRLLTRIVEDLSTDHSFSAGWLVGSLGRGAGDAFSDLDLVLAVEEPLANQICARPLRVAAGAPDIRRALFSRFGEPLNIHENHNNAPHGGTFSSVLYANPPVIVDWVLAPRSIALRPAGTRLLFDRAGIPKGIMPPANYTHEPGPPLSGPLWQAERLAFFWMMAMVAAKYILRGHAARTQVDWVLPFMADEISGLVQVERAALGESGGPAGRLRYLCGLVEARFPEASGPYSAVKALLALDQ